MSRTATATWTRPGDVFATVARAHARGLLLAAAAGAGYDPIRVPIRGPSAAQRSADVAATRAWIRQWQTPPRQVRVDWVTVTDRIVGRVSLPKTAWVDTVDAALDLVDARRDADAFVALVTSSPPLLHAWMLAHPDRVLAVRTDWPGVVAAASWIAEHDTPGIHLRQIPVPGVHTKLVETHRRVIADLVTVLRGPDTAAPATAGKTWFEDRYGFAAKPLRIRLRFLDPTLPGAPTGLTDVEIPVDQAASLPVHPTRVLVVENEVTFLALPPLPGTVAVFGQGHAAAALLSAVGWATSPGTAVDYWGDIDTHGFAALNRVREIAPHTRSLLMDTATLLAHRDAWASEDSPTAVDLPHLTATETDTYRSLVTGRYGPGIRLEQELLPWPTVHASLTAPGKESGDQASDRSTPAAG